MVHSRYTDEMVRVFKRLYEVRYPIRAPRRLVDHFGADDHRSMAADNTSAFNCRVPRRHLLHLVASTRTDERSHSTRWRIPTCTPAGLAGVWSPRSWIVHSIGGG